MTLHLGTSSVALRATRDAMSAHPAVLEARFWLFDDVAYNVFSQSP
jgi:hypothetical protein